MFKTLNKWITSDRPWQTLSRFFFVWLFTCTSIISSVTLFGIAPPAPAQLADGSCIPNVFYASESPATGQRLFAVDINTGEYLTVGTLAVTTAAISRDAATGRVYYMDRPLGASTRLYYFDPITGTNSVPIPVTNPPAPAPAFDSTNLFTKMTQRANGDIYASTNNDQLFIINKDTGATTAVTVTGTPISNSGGVNKGGDMAFDPTTGALYIVSLDEQEINLYRVDLTSSTTGTRSKITVAPIPLLNAGNLSSANSVAFGPDGNLYVSERDVATTNLMRVSTSNGSIISRRAISSAGVSPQISDFGTLPSKSPDVVMDVQKTASNTAVVAGGTLTYTIRLTNRGTCDAKGVQIQDTFPVQFTGATWTSRFVQAIDETLPGTGQMSPAGGTGDIDARVNLSAGSRLIVTITGTVPLGTLDGTPLTNTAIAITDRFIKSTITIPVIKDPLGGGTPDLSIRKEVPATYTTGGNVVYTLRVKNEGTATPTNPVIVADPSPPGTTFVSSSSSAGTCTAFPCSLPAALFPPSPPAAEVVITATFATSASTPLQLDNVATVSSVGEDGRLLGNNRAIARTIAPTSTVVILPLIPPVVDVAIGVTAPPSIPPGSTFTVTLTARNIGTANADNVVVGYDVPAGVTVVSVPSGCVYNASASTIICASIPSFGRGATASYDFVFKAPDTPTILTGVARISTTSPEPNTGNNSAAATTTVDTGAPDPNANPSLPPGIVIPPGILPPTVLIPSTLGSTLQATNPPVNNRDGTETVTFTLRIINTGTQTLSNLQAVIDLVKTFTGVQNFAVLSINSSDFLVNSSFNGMDLQNLLANGNVLTPGATGSITFSVRVTPGANLGPYLASATVRGTDPNGVILTDISTSGTVPDANGNGTPSDDFTPTSIQFTGLPNLRIVKRMTNALRNGVPVANINFTTFLDDPNDSNDNAPGWSALSPVGLARITEANLLQSGDDLEYTVYFLSDGTGVASNALFCDPIPAGSAFLGDTYGAGLGTLLRLEGSEKSQTNAIDGDPGRFIPALTPAPSPCPNPNNSHGAVFIQIPTLSNRSPNNVGFLRFRVRID